jgi:hypothetical protein
VKLNEILVLSDGHSWSSVDGCSIKLITDQQLDDLCEGRVDVDAVEFVTEIQLTALAGNTTKGEQ